MHLPWKNGAPPDAAQVAAEFADFLRQNWSHLQVNECDAEHVALTMPDGVDAKLYLHKLHGAIAGLRHNNAKTRLEVYAAFAQQMLAEDKQIPDLGKLDAAQMTTKIFPRVVRSDMFAAWEKDAGAPLQMPQRPLPGTDFVIAYVLDFDDRVAYVMGQQAESLNMDEEAFFRHAMDNARVLFSREDFAGAMSQFGPKKVAQFVECPDGHASARLLLLPEYLEVGESVAALVMENSVFLLAQIPPSNNWNPLREVARRAGSPHLHQPFLVTRDGIKAM